MPTLVYCKVCHKTHAVAPGEQPCAEGAWIEEDADRPRPPGMDHSFVGGGTTDAERAERICQCERCERDGQHVPTCRVHEEPPEACNCGKRTTDA